MNYINETTRIVYSIQSIRQANPNMSIPDGADLRDIGYERVYPALTTPITTGSEVLVSKPPEKVDGVWREVFAVEAAPVLMFSSCTPAQGLIALYELKDITEDEIVTMIEAIGDPLVRYRAQIAFNRATDWKIDHPVIQMLAQAKGLTEADINALFAYAAQVRV